MNTLKCHKSADPCLCRVIGAGVVFKRKRGDGFRQASRPLAQLAASPGSVPLGPTWAPCRTDAPSTAARPRATRRLPHGRRVPAVPTAGVPGRTPASPPPASPGSRASVPDDVGRRRPSRVPRQSRSEAHAAGGGPLPAAGAPRLVRRSVGYRPCPEGFNRGPEQSVPAIRGVWPRQRMRRRIRRASVVISAGGQVTWRGFQGYPTSLERNS